MALDNRAGRKIVRAGRSALGNMPSWNTAIVAITPLSVRHACTLYSPWSSLAVSYCYTVFAPRRICCRTMQKNSELAHFITFCSRARCELFYSLPKTANCSPRDYLKSKQNSTVLLWARVLM